MSDGLQRFAPRRKTIRFLDNREAALEDLINDPIAVLLRRSDNITLSDVRDALRRGRGTIQVEDARGSGR